MTSSPFVQIHIWLLSVKCISSGRSELGTRIEPTRRFILGRKRTLSPLSFRLSFCKIWSFISLAVDMGNWIRRRGAHGALNQTTRWRWLGVPDCRKRALSILSCCSRREWTAERPEISSGFPYKYWHSYPPLSLFFFFSFFIIGILMFSLYVYRVCGRSKSGVAVYFRQNFCFAVGMKV